jgi:hypothetical protein
MQAGLFLCTLACQPEFVAHVLISLKSDPNAFCAWKFAFADGVRNDNFTSAHVFRLKAQYLGFRVSGVG